MHRRQLPIVQPCDESWEDMSGDGAVRHCDSCDEYVHDLSVMSGDEALAFLREREQLCVRYRFDAAGRILFAAALSVAASGCLMGRMPSREPCEPTVVEEQAPGSPHADPPEDVSAEAPAAAPASEDTPQ